jgi:hypothetical protein
VKVDARTLPDRCHEKGFGSRTGSLDCDTDDECVLFHFAETRGSSSSTPGRHRHVPHGVSDSARAEQGRDGHPVETERARGSIDGASNRLIDIEDLSEEELEALHRYYTSSCVWRNETPRRRPLTRSRKRRPGTPPRRPGARAESYTERLPRTEGGRQWLPIAPFASCGQR